MAHGGWIGVDLDGTLAHYERDSFSEDRVGKPITAMVDKVKTWLAEGREVRIFTARKPSPAIRRWSKENLGRVLPITNVKDWEMIALYDDRAVGVKRNEGTPFSSANEEQVWRK